jgi:hypothetical protein
VTKLRTVAALYVDPRGPYPKMPGVECWDETRDARLYDGPHPVVAHPPCKNWSSLRHLATTNESDCGLIAFAQVRKFGGVLEQPNGSRLFEAVAAPMPGRGRCADVGETIEVEQVAWGHVARKKTWLYFVGIDRYLVLAGVKTGGTVTHWCSGFRSSTHATPKRYKQNGCAVPPGIKVCSAQQRRRTPPLFAEWLVSLARSVRQ